MIDQKPRYAIDTTKIGLFLACLYSTTPYSANPKQKAIEHLYSDIKWLYFTNVALYLTIATVVVGAVYRYREDIFPVYNVMLPMAISFEVIVTIMFWGLYSIDPKLIVNKNSLIPGNETPWIQELGLHLFPLILLIVDQIGVRIVYHKMQTVTQMSALLLWYLVVNIVAHRRGKFIYPFMNIIDNNIYRFILMCIFMPCAYGIHKSYMAIKTRFASTKE